MAHPEFTLLGDAAWLDFVNTAGGRCPSPPDLLPDVAAYQRWAHAQHWDPDTEGTPFGTVRHFRDLLTSLAEALHDGLQPPAAVIAAINEQLARSTGTNRLTRVGGEWRMQFAPSRPLPAIEAIARSAAATLTEPTMVVRRCAGETCSLFFTDSSPSQSRRWCSPALCGTNGRVERRRGMLR
jgi:predicted RNA-binding Zn ribbon-like protein